MLTPPKGTDVRICVYYRRGDAETCDYQIDIACKGAEPQDLGVRAACGILLIALSIFSVTLDVPADVVPPLPERFSHYVLIDTEAQRIYTSESTAVAASQIASTVFSMFASQIGVCVDPLAKLDAVSFISEAIRSLGGTDLESMINSTGGQA
jgi:hypothetical protein